MSSAIHARMQTIKRRSRTCSVPDCSRLVVGLSQFCPAHKTRALRHGSPTQRTIRASELEPYRKQVAEFATLHAGHPALLIVAAYVEAWIEEGAARAEAREGRKIDPKRDKNGQRRADLEMLRLY